MITQNPDGSLGYIYLLEPTNKEPEPTDIKVIENVIRPEIVIQIEPNDLLENKKKIIIYFCYQEMFLNFILPIYLNQIYIIFPVILCTLTGINSVKYNNKGGYIFYLVYLTIDYIYKLCILSFLIISIKYDCFETIKDGNCNKINKVYFIYTSLFAVILFFNTFAMRLFIKYYPLIS